MIFSTEICLEIVLWGSETALLKVCVPAFSYQALCLDEGEDVHRGFQSLLTEINRSGTQCLLRTANRLFGEKTYDFLPVSGTSVFDDKEMENKIDTTEERR